MFKRITKVTKDYQKKATELHKVYSNAVQFAQENFKGDYLDQKLSEAEAAYRSGYDKARQTYITDATAALSDMRSTVKQKLGIVDGKALEGLNQLRGMQISLNELEGLIEANKTNYYGLKIIKDIAEASGFKLGELPIDGMLFVVDKLENELSRFVNFNGGNAFENHSIVEITQSETPFSGLEGEFVRLNAGGMIEITAAEQISTNTQEQMKMVKNIFEASADKFVTAQNLVNLGMTEFITGTEYEAFLPEQE